MYVFMCDKCLFLYFYEILKFILIILTLLLLLPYYYYATRSLNLLIHIPSTSGSITVLMIINNPEGILLSSDKTRLFSMNFTSNSMLVDKGHLLPDFLIFTKHKLFNISITTWEFSRLIKRFDSKKAPDKIPVGVLRNISSNFGKIL